MIRFDKTITKKVGEKTITNNLITERITITGLYNVPYKEPYCILAIDETQVLIQKSSQLQLVPKTNIPPVIIELLEAPEPKESNEPKQAQKKTSKTTIKGKKEEDKK